MSEGGNSANFFARDRGEPGGGGGAEGATGGGAGGCRCRCRSFLFVCLFLGPHPGSTMSADELHTAHVLLTHSIAAGLKLFGSSNAVMRAGEKNSPMWKLKRHFCDKTRYIHILFHVSLTPAGYSHVGDSTAAARGRPHPPLYPPLGVLRYAARAILHARRMPGRARAKHTTGPGRCRLHGAPVHGARCTRCVRVCILHSLCLLRALNRRPQDSIIMDGARLPTGARERVLRACHAHTAECV